jgi:hypothetical protein
LGRHSPGAIAGSKWRQSPSRIAFIVAPTLPSYAAMALVLNRTTTSDSVGAVLSALAGAAVHISIIGVWMHSDDLDHEGGLRLLQSVPKPSLLRALYRSTPSILLLHWIGICAFLCSFNNVDDHDGRANIEFASAAFLVMEAGASSMIINEVRILVFGNAQSGWHRPPAAVTGYACPERYGTEGIRAVHPPCMLAMLCFYAGGVTLHLLAACCNVTSAMSFLSLVGSALTLLPIVHSGAVIWSLSRSTSRRRARTTVRMWPTSAESIFKWAIGWRGTAVLNVVAMMLSFGLSVAYLTLVLAAFNRDPPSPAVQNTTMAPTAAPTDVVFASTLAVVLAWFACAAFGLVAALNTLLGVRFDCRLFPTDEAFRVNVVLKVFMLALKAELNMLTGPAQTTLKSLVMFSYVVSLLITAWISLALQSLKAFKYPEDLRRIRRPRRVLVCYAINFFVAKLLAVLLIVLDLTPASQLPEFCVSQNHTCTSAANHSVPNGTLPIPIATNESTCGIADGCMNLTGGPYCCRGSYGSDGFFDLLADERIFVSCLILGLVALVYLNNEVHCAVRARYILHSACTSLWPTRRLFKFHRANAGACCRLPSSSMACYPTGRTMRLPSSSVHRPSCSWALRPSSPWSQHHSAIAGALPDQSTAQRH